MEYERITIENQDYNGCCVYAIKNLDNGKIYFGETIHYYERIYCHCTSLSMNYHRCKQLQEDYNNGNHLSIYVLEIYDNHIGESFLRNKEANFIEDFREIVYNKVIFNK